MTVDSFEFALTKMDDRALEDTLLNLQKEQVDLLKKLNKVYTTNKKYFIKSEEYFNNMNFWLAPVLEHRDALDHLLRGFSVEFLSITEKVSLLDKTMIFYKHNEQLKKALAHELRAFFDVADYICIKLRGEIASDLKKIKRKQIESIWTEYLEQKQNIFKLSTEIARIRESRGESLDSVFEYSEQLENLFKFYQDYRNNIEPKLKKKV